MGIFNFWGWFKNNFSGTIHKLGVSSDLESIDINIDNLLIDMNGLFHTSAQKIYKYGTYKPKDKNIPLVIPNNKLQLKVYEDICKNIENLTILCKPKKLILAIDGPAPYAKIVQQRRRRFAATMNKEEDDKGFDSNCITPGTKFMDHLSKYIDWFIRKKISEDPLWKDIEIVFSNEKVQGEGENKIISYIRKHGNKDESYIIHGLDADIIMLSLGMELEYIYVLRDDLYDKANKYFVVNINLVSLQLGEMMRWKSEIFVYDSKNVIRDFIFLCISENTPISLICGLSVPIQMITNNKFPILSFNEKETKTTIITSYFSKLIENNGKYKLKMADFIYGNKNIGLEQDEIEFGAIGPNNKGKKSVYKLTLLDGRELIITPNHEIRTQRGYIKANELNYGYNNNVILKDSSKYIISKSKLVDDSEFTGSNVNEADCCLVGPDTFTLNIENEINNRYYLHMSNIKDLTFETTEDVYRSLAFSRILGYIYADGTILENGCHICLGHHIDVIEIQKDIKIICGKINKPYWLSTIHESQLEYLNIKEKYNFGCWNVPLPTNLYKSILNLPGIMIGKRSMQEPSFPEYLFDIHTPSSMIREFMAGFFGGDGGTISTSNDLQKVTNNIPLSQYIVPEYSEKLQKICTCLSRVLKEKLDIESYLRGPYYDNEKNRVKWTLVVNSALEFSEKISFRYCYSKQIRLSIACCWFRFEKNTINQRKEMFKLIFNESKNTKNYKVSSLFKKIKFINNKIILDYKNLSRDNLRKYSSKIGILTENKTKLELIKEIDNYVNSISNTHPFIEQKLNKIPVLSIYSQFTQENLSQYIRNILFKNKIKKEISFKSFIDFIEDKYKDIDTYLNQCKFDIGQEIKFKDFIEKIGAINIFLKHTHWPERNNLNIPTYNLPIINIEKLEQNVNVYDLSITNNHSFVANSCVVHNCFMIGNDFLPHIPSLEILEGGIDIILNIYRDIGTIRGHLTKDTEKEITFSKSFLQDFLNSISEYEKNILENKLKNKRIYFPDEILESCVIYNEGNPNLDIKKYREEYTNTHFGKNINNVCFSYLEGLNWVINYYKKSCINWKWYYPYDHAPSASVISTYISTFKLPIYKISVPLTPFQQLIAVLPPKSSSILPYPLNELLLMDNSPLKEFCPDKFKIDLSGKKHEYQGVVILPMVDPVIIVNAYSSKVGLVNPYELKRNIFGKSYIYKYDSETSEVFKSFYGDINNCKVKSTPIFL